MKQVAELLSEPGTPLSGGDASSCFLAVIEVYVLDDGEETDLDLGRYERFTNVQLTRLSPRSRCQAGGQRCCTYMTCGKSGR